MGLRDRSHPRPLHGTLSPVSELSHVDARGEARMVDVTHKPALFREAEAAGEIRLNPATLALIESNQVAKGNVLATARLAGIMAAKRTAEPLPVPYTPLTLPPKRGGSFVCVAP